MEYFEKPLRKDTRKAIRLLTAIGLSGLLAIVLASCGPYKEEGLHLPPSTHATEPVEPGAVAIQPPPFSEGIFPCTNCHDPSDEVDTTRRELGYHDEVVLQHDEKNRWCLDCHDAKNRDQLHLADGRPVKFTESYRLCGQCHGPQLRDWKAGEHGKRTGSWSGDKTYMLCVSCHNPHSPKFKPIKPLPPPLRQEDIK